MGFSLILLAMLASYDAARTIALEQNKPLIVFVNVVPTDKTYNKLASKAIVIITHDSRLTRIVQCGIIISNYHETEHDLAIIGIFKPITPARILLNCLDKRVY